MTTQLKVFRAAEDEFEDLEMQEPSVRVRLGDLLPLVAMAQRMNFIWVKDFLDDVHRRGILAPGVDLHVHRFRSTQPRRQVGGRVDGDDMAEFDDDRLLCVRSEAERECYRCHCKSCESHDSSIPLRGAAS